MHSAHRLPIVPEHVAQIAADYPERVAFHTPLGDITYANLNARANQVAHYLISCSVLAEDTVGIAMDRSVDFAVAALGIWKAGAAYVPLDRSYPAERLKSMMHDAKLSLVLLESSAVEPFAAEMACVPLSDPAILRQRSDPPDRSLSGDHLAYLVFTSGTTGAPKAVEITHSNVSHLVGWHTTCFAVTPDDRGTLLANVGFDAAVWELWPCLCVGASLTIPPTEIIREPDLLIDWLVEHSVTIAFIPTLLAEVLIQTAWPSHTRLRILLTGGDVLRKYPNVGLPFRVINNYGPAECTVVSTSGEIIPNEHAAPLPDIGRAIAGSRVYLLDERQQMVPQGSPGEICIGGPGVARGYRQRPEITAKKFITRNTSDTGPERLYRTGDLGRLQQDGSIHFLGRLDDQVQIRGFRVECGEVEAALNTMSLVQTSAVIGREDSSGACHLIGYVVPTQNASLTHDMLRRHLRLTLPEYMLPERFVHLETLPKTENGKMDREHLPAPDETNLIPSEEKVESLVERELLAILERLLKVSAIGRDDNFFMLGGHSFIAAQLIARIRATFRVELGLRAVFDHPTVTAMAQQIEQQILAKL